MHEMNPPEEHILEDASGNCVNCQGRAALPGHPTALCEQCREAFIKYPIPLWIKLFAGGVVLAILFSLFTFPDNLSLAIHLKRGEQAANNYRYVTAKREFERVLNKHPKHVQARGYLMLSSFYNGQYDSFAKYEDELSGVEFEDDDLLSQLNDVSRRFSNYYIPDDTLIQAMSQYDSVNHSLPDSFLMDFVVKHPSNIYGLCTYAARLYNADNYIACDSILVQLLELDDTYLPALNILANSKRQTGDYNASIKYCERILEINHESSYAYANMARTYLKQRKDKDALAMAEKCMSLDDKDPYNMATLALAYHFNRQVEKRDALIKTASKDSVMMQSFQYVIDVIDNKESFR